MPGLGKVSDSFKFSVLNRSLYAEISVRLGRINLPLFSTVVPTRWDDGGK